MEILDHDGGPVVTSTPDLVRRLAEAIDGPTRRKARAFEVVLVVLAVVALFRGVTQGRGSGSQQDPMDILDQRFARGEIDEDEYHARAAVLRTSVR